MELKPRIICAATLSRQVDSTVQASLVLEVVRLESADERSRSFMLGYAITLAAGVLSSSP